MRRRRGRGWRRWWWMHPPLHHHWGGGPPQVGLPPGKAGRDHGGGHASAHFLPVPRQVAVAWKRGEGRWACAVVPCPGRPPRFLFLIFFFHVLVSLWQRVACPLRLRGGERRRGGGGRRRAVGLGLGALRLDRGPVGATAPPAAADAAAASVAAAVGGGTPIVSLLAVTLHVRHLLFSRHLHRRRARVAVLLGRWLHYFAFVRHLSARQFRSTWASALLGLVHHCRNIHRVFTPKIRRIAPIIRFARLPNFLRPSLSSFSFFGAQCTSFHLGVSPSSVSRCFLPSSSPFLSSRGRQSSDGRRWWIGARVSTFCPCIQ